MFIEVPAKVIQGSVRVVTGATLWPYNNGDPYWSGGSSPKNYQWDITLDLTEQTHSSPMTRKPYFFNGQDVQVGDYVSDTSTGITVKIMAVNEKSDTSVTCRVEDVLRYNTFRDSSQAAVGIFDASSQIVIYEVNEEGQPVIDPAPSSVGSVFFANLSSRFQNLEENYNFILEKTAHGFAIGDLIAADPDNHTFVLADTGHPYLIGTVSNIDIGPDQFMVNPFQKIVDGYSSLIGGVGSIIYANTTVAGSYSLDGSHPVMIKLRDQTNTTVVGSNLSANSATMVGSSFNINNIPVAISNTGFPDDFVTMVNEATANTGVIANLVEVPITVTSDLALLNTFGVPVAQLPVSATINDVPITFTTTTSGAVSLGPGYADQYDMAADINAANIPDVVATATASSLVLTNATNIGIVITNDGVDAMGNPFAGAGSCSGLALSTTTGVSYITLTAIDARAINLYDTLGTATSDFGLVSAENGIKAAALYIEQGVRTASTYVVANIPARDGLTATFGDQVYVQDTGNGEWAFYIRTLDAWVKIADQDSSETDAQSIEVNITPESPSSGLIHTISDGRRVSFVTVTIDTPFDDAATVTVGDDGQNDRLMTADQNDLTGNGSYSTTPAYTYATGSDTDIKFYFNVANATVGNAIVAITYT